MAGDASSGDPSGSGAEVAALRRELAEMRATVAEFRQIGKKGGSRTASAGGAAGVANSAVGTESPTGPTAEHQRMNGNCFGCCEGQG